MTSTPPVQRPGHRNVAPIRWPKADPHTLVVLGVWLVGALVAIGVPALIVPPTQQSTPTGRALLAFGFTVVGVVIMVAVGFRLYRRHRDSGWLVFTIVPSGTLLLGGFIFLGTKLFTG